MKTGNKRFRFTFSILTGLITCIFTLPAIAQNTQDILIGKWQAEWEMAGNAPEIEVTGGKDQYMLGKMEFLEGGEVKIDAFGYPGCLFSNDTINNQLNWVLLKDTIRLYSKDQQFSLEYAIQNMEETFIKLNLMGDIFITLRR